jgi:hypothetical protein
MFCDEMLSLMMLATELKIEFRIQPQFHEHHRAENMYAPFTVWHFYED